MKSIYFLAVFCLISITVLCQSKIDTVLQKRIMSMFKEDQKWRIESQNIYNGKKSKYDEGTINRNMAKTDSLNLMEAKSIISAHGFPGYNLVGEFSNNFWAIVQHCDDDVKFQKQVLLLLKRQVELKNASAENYALLQDRVLISTGKKQLYGTQVRYNPKTKTAKPFPVEDSTHVDERRKAVGLAPLAEYLKVFDRN
jgi:hypothetical protein